MKFAPGLPERLGFMAEVVLREAGYLAQTDARLFAEEFGLTQVSELPHNPDLAERVDAFVARFGRLQDTLAVGLLPRMRPGSLPIGRLNWLEARSPEACTGPRVATSAGSGHDHGRSLRSQSQDRGTELLDRVAAGETALITRRGLAAALMSPPDRLRRDKTRPLAEVRRFRMRCATGKVDLEALIDEGRA